MIRLFRFNRRPSDGLLPPNSEGCNAYGFAMPAQDTEARKAYQPTEVKKTTDQIQKGAKAPLPGYERTEIKTGLFGRIPSIRKILG